MSGGNQGIQGTNINITADALAVGTRARATSRRVSRETTQAALGAVDDLKRALAALDPAGGVREQVAASVEKLETTVADPQVQPGRVAAALQHLIGALDKAGTVVAKVTAIAEPVAKLAGVFGLPIPWR
jgi:hypothetical protein